MNHHEKYHDDKYVKSYGWSFMLKLYVEVLGLRTRLEGWEQRVKEFVEKEGMTIGIREMLLKRVRLERMRYYKEIENEEIKNEEREINKMRRISEDEIKNRSDLTDDEKSQWIDEVRVWKGMIKRYGRVK